MRKLLIFAIAAIAAVSMTAQEKFSFVIAGDEDTYNQVRVINRSSVMDLPCRVVILDDNDNILSVYGVYTLKGYDSSDSNTERIKRGTKIGLQFPKDFDHELIYSVEYRDYPLFDAVVVVLYDKDGEFSSEF